MKRLTRFSEACVKIGPYEIVGFLLLFALMFILDTSFIATIVTAAEAGFFALICPVLAVKPNSILDVFPANLIKRVRRVSEQNGCYGEVTMPNGKVELICFDSGNGFENVCSASAYDEFAKCPKGVREMTPEEVSRVGGAKSFLQSSQETFQTAGVGLWITMKFVDQDK